MRSGSAASVCRSFATGCCASVAHEARGPDGLVDGKSPGAPSKLNADHRRALAEVVEAGPVPAVDGVVRWRRKDLARWLLETFAISLDETTAARVEALGFAKISARPTGTTRKTSWPVEALMVGFPGTLAKIRARLGKGVEIELWWQDEARIGQKNKLTRRWARRGTRPRAPRDQRGPNGPISSARSVPRRGRRRAGHALVRHRRHGGAPSSRSVPPSIGAHAVLIRSGRLALDAQAGDPRQPSPSWRCRHDRPS